MSKVKDRRIEIRLREKEGLIFLKLYLDFLLRAFFWEILLECFISLSFLAFIVLKKFLNGRDLKFLRKKVSRMILAKFC